MQHIYIGDMTPGIRVIGYYIISDLHPGITLPDGHDYWQIMLADEPDGIRQQHMALCFLDFVFLPLFVFLICDLLHGRSPR